MKFAPVSNAYKKPLHTACISKAKAFLNPEVLKAAGYDPSWFAQGCKSSLRRRILEEADSEQGLRPPRGLSTEQQLAAFEAKDLSTQKTDASIKELQERIVHLEKQVEFLKKISNIVTNPKLQ